MSKSDYPKDIFKSYPLLTFFTRNRYILIFLDKKGFIKHCHHQASHRKVLLANQLTGKFIHEFFNLPKNQDLGQILSKFPDDKINLKNLHWPSEPTGFDTAIFYSTPLCDSFVLPPGVFINFPQSLIHFFMIDSDNYIGLISFPDYDPPVSWFTPEIILLTSMDHIITGYNRSLVNLLRLDSPESLLDTSLNKIVDFEFQSGVPPDYTQAALTDKTITDAMITFKDHPDFKVTRGRPLKVENHSEAANHYLHLNVPVNHDLNDFTFSYSMEVVEGTFPPVMLRSGQYDPPDTFGYLFGPHASQHYLMFKKKGIELKKIPFPGLRAQREFHFQIDKIDNQMNFQINKVPVYSFREYYDLPPNTGSRIAFIIRPKTRCIISNMQLAVSAKRPQAIPVVLASFKNRRHRFRVHQEPTSFSTDHYYVYRFENITGFEREISRLKKEKQEVSEEKLKIEKEMKSRQAVSRFIGSNTRIHAVKETLRTLAESAQSLLLVGETGTGKEVLASLFHDISPRHDRPFIKVDCSTLPPSLIESELFGYEPGAFTGANRRHTGKFEQANGGTLFLDEIANLSMEVQAKLLGVLEDFKITPLGSTRPVELSLNLVAASNKNLNDLIGQKLFREDLFYRLNRFKIEIPPLRDRPDDIPALCMAFVESACREYNKKIKGLSEDAYIKLHNHTWPGNVRELKNVIFRAVLFAKGDIIKPANLEILKEPARAGSGLPAASRRKRVRITKENLNASLDKNEGNIFAVADYFGVTRSTVYNNMKKYNLNPDDYRAA